MYDHCSSCEATVQGTCLGEFPSTTIELVTFYFMTMLALTRRHTQIGMGHRIDVFGVNGTPRFTSPVWNTWVIKSSPDAPFGPRYNLVQQ